MTWPQSLGKTVTSQTIDIDWNSLLACLAALVTSAADLQSYWKERYHWTTAQLSLVDNTGTKAAASKLCAATDRRIYKLQCGWLPVNSRESRIDPDWLPGCSACSMMGLVTETVDHIFQCRAASWIQAIKEIFSRFHDKFREMKTSKLLILALHTGATAWVEGMETPDIASLALPDSTLGRLIAQAYTDQALLGWNLLCWGFWATSWRLGQEEQFR